MTVALLEWVSAKRLFQAARLLPSTCRPAPVGQAGSSRLLVEVRALDAGRMKVPWGYREVRPGMVIREVSYTEERRRHELGETAITLLERLGVSLEQLNEILDAVDEGMDPLTKLTQLQEQPDAENPNPTGV